MQAVKYLLYGVGALIVLGILLIVVVVATFDPNTYKPQIVQLVKDRTGRTLTIEGDIGLKLFPKIGAQLGKVALSDRDGSAEFAGLNQAQVYLALLPLLRREVVVDRVRVDGLRANLLKRKDGSTNFDDLAGRAEKPASVPAPAPEPAQPAKPIRLDVSGVRITNSRIGWKDETNGNQLAVELVELETGRVAEKTPIDVALRATIKGVQPKVDLKAALTGTLTYDLGGQQYNVKGLDAKLDGSALDVSGIALAITGDFAALGTVPRVMVSGLVVTAKAKAGQDNLDLNLSAPKLELTPDTARGDSALLTVKLAGAQRSADIALKLSGVEGSATGFKIAALTIDLDAKQQDHAVKGRLSTPVTGNLETRLFELPKLAADFALTSPAIPQKTMQVPLNGLVRADLGQERVFADIVTRFDESNIKAKGGISRFAAPAYDFDVTIDRLNVDRYRPAKKAEATPAPAQTGPAGREQPIDLSPLKPLDLAGNVKVGQLQVNNIKAANVRVDVRAKGGKLDVDPLSANLYEGSTRGAIRVDANSNRVAVKQALTGVAIGPLLRDAAQKDILEGKGNVALDLTTQGNLVSAMKRALNGKARLELKDGAVKGVDLAGAVRNVKAKFGGKDAEAAAARGEKTDFSDLTASFDIRNGIARNDDLSLKSPFLRVTGAGAVNIGEDSLDYVVKTAIVGSMAGQGGKELAELKGLSVPVRVYGPYAALRYKVELSQVFGGKEQLGAAKQTAREAAKSKLQELLGGKPADQQPPGADQAQPAAPAKQPKDALKDKLKQLLR